MPNEITPAAYDYYRSERCRLEEVKKGENYNFFVSLRDANFGTLFEGSHENARVQNQTIRICGRIACVPDAVYFVARPEQDEQVSATQLTQESAKIPEVCIRTAGEVYTASSMPKSLVLGGHDGLLRPAGERTASGLMQLMRAILVYRYGYREDVDDYGVTLEEGYLCPADISSSTPKQLVTAKGTDDGMTGVMAPVSPRSPLPTTQHKL